MDQQPLGRNHIIIYDVVNGQLIARLLVDGQPVAFWVVPPFEARGHRLARPTPEQVIEIALKALLATIAVIALLGGNPAMALLAVSMLKALETSSSK